MNQEYSASTENDMEIEATELSTTVPIGLNTSIVQKEHVSTHSKLYLRHDYYSDLKMLGFTYKQVDPWFNVVFY